MAEESARPVATQATSSAAPAQAAAAQTTVAEETTADGDTHIAALEAEAIDDEDGDSALGITDDQLSSESLRSSIYHYHMENGRMYHSLSQGKYILPNDEEENDRLDIQNHHFRVTFDGRQYFAPGADSAKRVLDVGTGTGIWAIEFADDHPDATVIGVDLSPIQPEFVPPNCQFEVDDLEKEWTWTKPFDYIFSRMMIMSFASWDNYLVQADRHLAPGGWIEMIDIYFPGGSDDGTLTEDLNLFKWNEYMRRSSVELGRDWMEVQNHKKRLVDFGYQNVQQKNFKWPINTWPKDKKHKEVGLWTLANIEAGLEGLCMALFTRGLGWTKEEVVSFVAAVRKEMRDPRIHAYWQIVVIYGQKPYDK
ncbi:unnamed protein product [Clonostachys solani]|uniref:Methyltransferase n=1 Tax=Clonostachys solani TaxID=160281 RepID=A0A9N9ZMJ8_9HYPO|nr:unnamed protein product [Clonostachys solani]